MNYVIIRDDDTCALTPVSCIERLYRPFLDRCLPVNLAVIPNVNTRATWADGSEEGFLFAKRGGEPTHLAIGENRELTEYLRANEGLRPVHHGFEHTYLEFDRNDAEAMARKLDDGVRCFEAAGIAPPKTFVAPYDQLSRASYREVAQRFRVLSTGWFELRRLPVAWWPRFILKKALRRRHWRAGGLTLLSHPGCLLSHKREPDSILPLIRRTVLQNKLTVLVTHWWEYFHRGRTNEAFIATLHETAAWLAAEPGVRVVPFSAIEDPESAIAREIFQRYCQPFDAPPLGVARELKPSEP